MKINKIDTMLTYKINLISHIELAHLTYLKARPSNRTTTFINCWRVEPKKTTKKKQKTTKK
jgi:hypothetical protein